MALSGKRLLVGLGLLTAAALIVSACLPSSPRQAQIPHQDASSSIQQAPLKTHDARPAVSGDPIASPSLTWQGTVDGRPATPAGWYGDRLLASIGAGSPDGETIALVDPATGDHQDLWTVPEGQQDIVTSIDGDWAAVVRTGLQLPFPDWTLYVRNLASGEARLLAKSDEDVEDEPGVQPVLPLGFAPSASLSGGQVAWAQYQMSGDGAVRAIHLYRMDDSRERVLDTTPASSGDLLSPSLAGPNAAWLHIKGTGAAEIVLRDLTGNSERRFPIDGSPVSLALANGGSAIAWDDTRGSLFVFDLSSGALWKAADGQGWGVEASSSRISWSPAAAYGGHAGYFDLATGTTHLLPFKSGVTTNVSGFFGPWFGWQELIGSGASATDTYQFIGPGT